MLKTWLSNYLLKHVLGLITEEGSIEIGKTGKFKGLVYIDGKRVPEPEQKELVAQAKVIKAFKVYDLVLNDIKLEATRNLINKSKVIEDMVYAKAMLYTVDVLDKKFKALSELSQ